MSDPLTLEELGAMVSGNPAAFWIGMLAKWGGLGIGLALLVRHWLFWDRVRGGVVAAPVRRSPTPLLSAPAAVGLAVLAFVVVPSVLAFLGLLILSSEHQMAAAFASTALATVPAAIWVLRRQRATLLPSRAVAEAYEAFDAEARDDPERPPRRTALGVLGGGLWTYCVASVFVVPAFVLSAALVLLFKGSVEPQALIQQLVRDPDPVFPVVLLVFGVLIAPFTEECLFRGLLYPSLKRGLGGGRSGALWSAGIVSVAFAAIHWDLLAFLPLLFLALVLTWVYERTASLGVVIVAHAVNNFLALLPVLLLRS